MFKSKGLKWIFVMSSRLKETICVWLILVGTLAFFYRDVVFGGHSFMPEGSMMGTMPLNSNGTEGPYGYVGPLNYYERDQWTKAVQTEPDNRLMTLTYQAGQIPLWNPHEGLGTPFYASGEVGVFDPVRLMLTALIPSSWWLLSVDAHLLLRYFLGG